MKKYLIFYKDKFAYYQFANSKKIVLDGIKEDIFWCKLEGSKIRFIKDYKVVLENA